MSNNSNSCCSGDSCEPVNPLASSIDEHAVREQVRAGYAKIAEADQRNSEKSGSGENVCGSNVSSGGGGCCGPATFTPQQLASAIGYSESDISKVPDSANMGLSCGNPTAIASLRPGEVVLDLGAGGGFDCFIAGPKVGANGRVIGVDMTPEMISKARRNMKTYRDRTGLENVEFRLGEIENLPAADSSVDVIISNCVLNLSPDKAKVWREIARVLKPGGRVAVSDLALIRPLPKAVRESIEALIGCVAGAVLVDETRRFASGAGLVEIVITTKPQYVDAMANWEDPLYREIVANLPNGSMPSDYITSIDISGRKPQ